MILKTQKKIPAARLLLDRDLCKTLEEASALIYAGCLIADDQRVEKPGQKLSTLAILRLKKQRSFVSRGAYKLKKAIEDLNLQNSFQNKVVLDIGASKGGFTDLVLELGASHVIAIDVGTNQLDWRLRNDKRVTSLEKTDIRVFNPQLYPPCDWVLADISFNSLERLALSIKNAAPKAHFLLLVKPQFELPGRDIPDGGIVENEDMWNKAKTNVAEAFTNLGAQDIQFIQSSLKGKKGNQEFFIYFSFQEASKTDLG